MPRRRLLDAAVRAFASNGVDTTLDADRRPG
jgi:hypothetical protein